MLEVAIGDYAWIDFARPMLASTQPLLIGDSGSWKTQLIQLCSRIINEAFPDENLPALITRESMQDIVATRPKAYSMPLAHSSLDEIGALFESMDASYNKTLRDFELKLLDGECIGKMTKQGVVPTIPVKYDLLCATTPERFNRILPSRLDVLDGLPVRFSPVVVLKKSDDQMPPIINPSTLVPLITSFKTLRTSLVTTPMRLVHTTASMPVYEKLVKTAKKDVKAIRMHPANFGRAKMNFSRICISEEIANFGTTSNSISLVSAEVAKEEALASARDAYKLYQAMGPTPAMRELIQILKQAGHSGISKTNLRKESGMDWQTYKNAYQSLKECEILVEGEKKEKYKTVTMVRLA